MSTDDVVKSVVITAHSFSFVCPVNLIVILVCCIVWALYGQVIAQYLNVPNIRHHNLQIATRLNYFVFWYYSID